MHYDYGRQRKLPKPETCGIAFEPRKIDGETNTCDTDVILKFSYPATNSKPTGF